MENMKAGGAIVVNSANLILYVDPAEIAHMLLLLTVAMISL